MERSIAARLQLARELARKLVRVQVRIVHQSYGFLYEVLGNIAYAELPTQRLRGYKHCDKRYWLLDVRSIHECSINLHQHANHMPAAPELRLRAID
jgi:hypothetical protein